MQILSKAFIANTKQSHACTHILITHLRSTPMRILSKTFIANTKQSHACTHIMIIHLRSTPVRILSKALIIAQLNNLLVHNDSSHADVARAYATSTNTQLKCVHTHIDNSLALYAHADLV